MVKRKLPDQSATSWQWDERGDHHCLHQC